MKFKNKRSKLINVKQQIILMIAVFVAVQTGFAQNVKIVEPGNETLSAAVNSAETGDVLQLTGGGVYTITSSSTFGKITFPLTIQVEPGADEKAILRLGDGASTSKKYYFFEINDGAALTLKGMEIHGLLDGNVVAASMVLFDARPNPSEARIGNFVFENCVFHDFKDYIIHGMKDAYARGLIQDSVFIDNVVVYNAKHFLQYKHVSLHHLEMSNSTIYDMQGMALKIGKIGYRCVLESPGKPYVPITDETITPTGFIDHCTMNNLGDIHGHIQIDEAYHTLNITNCIFSNQQEFNQPPVYLNDAVVDTAIIISNTCFWNTAGFNGVDKSVYIFRDTLMINPDYKSVTIPDFSLPEDSHLLTFANDGSAIGDPKWKSYITSAPNFIQNESLLLTCFPNPVKDRLTIEFDIKRKYHVSVKIFNIFGNEVETVLNQAVTAGNHTVFWQATNKKPGIYFCTIQAGNYTETKRILLQD